MSGSWISRRNSPPCRLTADSTMGCGRRSGSKRTRTASPLISSKPPRHTTHNPRSGEDLRTAPLPFGNRPSVRGGELHDRENGDRALFDVAEMSSQPPSERYAEQWFVPTSNRTNAMTAGTPGQRRPLHPPPLPARSGRAPIAPSSGAQRPSAASASPSSASARHAAHTEDRIPGDASVLRCRVTRALFMPRLRSPRD